MFQHRLAENKRVETPSWMVFVDTEACINEVDESTQHQSLWFGYAECWRIRMDRKRRYYLYNDLLFTNYRDLWDLVTTYAGKSKITIYVVAHNWQYDAALLQINSLVGDYGFTAEFVAVDQGAFIVKLKRSDMNIVLLDSMNYFHTSLASLGSSIGLDKLETPWNSDDLDVWVEYCIRDVTVMRMAMFRFLDFIVANDLGSFAPTAASQAFHAYRHRFMKHTILFHDRQRVIELERQAYHGGRTEAFYIGTISKPVYALDINSMYPSVMRDQLFPYELLGSNSHCTIEQLAKLCEHYCVTAYVSLETNQNVYPTVYNDRLVFPIGRFETTLSTPELTYALEHNHIKSVSYVAWYKAGRLFEDYVNTLYTLRKEYKNAGNKAFELMVKLLLNSLYGKFGQRGVEWVESDYAGDIPEGVREFCALDPETGRVKQYRIVLDQLQERVVRGESRNSFVAIAAHVTAYARIKLYKLMEKAGYKHVYYCDTDSLYVDDEGYQKLATEIDQTRLGALKLETVAQSATIYGLKDYELDDKQRHKGIRNNAKLIGDATYQQDRFSSWIALHKRGEDDKIIVTKTIKHLRRVYDKGLLCADGWVEPIRLGG